MNIARFSIRRPIFITSIFLLTVILGIISLGRLGVDIFPDINLPFIIVNTVYPGAAAQEVEELITRPMEEEFSSIAGLKRISSQNSENYSRVICEFSLGTDVKWAEQEIRTKISRIRRQLPEGIEEPLILRIDPADQAVARIALYADLPPGKIYDLARETIKPRFEQIKNVGAVRLLGGVRREIQVELNRKELNRYSLSALQVANQLKSYGVNVPLGKYESGPAETVMRSLGRFRTISEIENVPITFSGDPGSSLTLKDVGLVSDGTEDITTIAEVTGPRRSHSSPEKLVAGKINSPAGNERETRPALLIDVFKQSGSNTIDVADGAIERMAEINEMIGGFEGHPRLVLIRDGSRWIRINVEDVGMSIILGILLTIVVVYFFLGNVRSTIITGLALPNSLLGAFVLMYAAGFTINVVTLLALSLSIGLLVDDAIVVRENIFRKLEGGMSPVKAAEAGTVEVLLAVIATSLTIIAVFLPIGFLGGIVGQFLRQLGFTVVFAMAVSLFDAITMAPLISAYFAGKVGEVRPNFLLRRFEQFQKLIDRVYDRIMGITLRFPWATLLVVMVIFGLSLFSLKFVKKTFMPSSDQGEFLVNIKLDPGTSLQRTHEIVMKIREKISTIDEVAMIAQVSGTDEGAGNIGQLNVILVDSAHRERSAQEIKDQVRDMMKEFTFASPSVSDLAMVGGGVQYPFNLFIMGDNLEEMEKYAKKVEGRLKKIPDLTDVGMDYRPGKPEFQVRLDPKRMREVGVQPAVAGLELRYHTAGGEVGKFYDHNIEYTIRLRMRPEDRDLQRDYHKILVPNIQYRMIPLDLISTPGKVFTPEQINRQDRARTIPIRANLSTTGAIGTASDIARKLLGKDLLPPPGIHYRFLGQSEDLRELIENILIGFGIALVFIYLTLSSLYESYITPFTILLAIPPAISGAFFALLLFNEMLSIFSMIGIILLMGLVTKNSILLVDYALEGIRQGLSRNEAIRRAGQIRLRPILMTSFAMIAGTLPIAIGLGEASRARKSMGIAIIGGLIVSTLVTLIVVPAVFRYIDTLREWIESRFRPDEPVD